jgi:hypothetical protein
MKRPSLLLLVVVAGCQPHYSSGKTQCSDKNECPSGFVCGNDGTNSVNTCFDRGTTTCSDTGTFYCPQTNTCWQSLVDCSTVSYCGTATTPDYGACKTSGYHPDCNGDSCLPNAGAGGSYGGAGGAAMGGTGGTGGTAPDGGVRDAAPDVASKDAGGGCGSGCSTGYQCLSGQCCVPPAAGGDCTVFPACGCSPGKVCYPSSTTHAMACAASSNLSEGASCSSGTSCQVGFGCFGGLCKRHCAADTDCPLVAGVQSCIQTSWSSDQTDILGVKVCERLCDPAHPQYPTAPLLSCPVGYNCTSSATGVSYCFQATPLPPGSACSSSADCAMGFYCTVSSVCRQYCLFNSDCASGTACQFNWTTPQYAGSTLVGYCM